MNNQRGRKLMKNSTDPVEMVLLLGVSLKNCSVWVNEKVEFAFKQNALKVF